MGTNILSKDFELKSNMSLLFDTNIWMYLYCPIGNHKRKEQDAASKLLKDAKTLNCELAIISLIIAEYSNACLRLDFKIWKDTTKNYDASFKKDYLNSAAFKTTQKLVAESIMEILSLCTKYPDDFHSFNLKDIQEDYRSIDFNDSYISWLSERKNWIIFTDDKDYQQTNKNVKIINI